MWLLWADGVTLLALLQEGWWGAWYTLRARRSYSIHYIYFLTTQATLQPRTFIKSVVCCTSAGLPNATQRRSGTALWHISEARRDRLPAAALTFLGFT